jgi:hypothetical protein
MCRYSEIFVCLNSHLIWQAAKSDVERGNALGLYRIRAYSSTLLVAINPRNSWAAPPAARRE